MRYYLYILGCQMNYSDAERIDTVLQDLGFTKTKDKTKAELIIFITCSVRQKAEDRVYGLVNNLRLPDPIIAITGCLVKKSGTQKSTFKDPLLKKLPPVDFVFRIEDLSKLGKLLQEIKPELKLKPFLNGNFKNYFHIRPSYETGFQAFIPVMTGCDNFCSYCVVPFTRGREKSRPMKEILEEADKLVKNGCKEITLLGQNVNSYGLSALDKKSGQFAHNKKPPFVTLLEKLNHLRSLQRIRFTSSHPKDMSDELIAACATLPKMCPYIHLPVQSGDNEILKKMNRSYTREHYLKLIKKIRQKIPKCALSTDIIVGFPGETRKQFENTYKLFQEVKWDMAYLARYSPRPGTAAARLKDNVSRAEKARRWHKLNKLLEKTSLEKNKAYVGKTVEILVETVVCRGGRSAAPTTVVSRRGQACLTSTAGQTVVGARFIAPTPEKHLYTGKTPSFKTVQFQSTQKNLLGQIVKVKITAAKEWILTGEI